MLIGPAPNEGRPSPRQSRILVRERQRCQESLALEGY